MIVRRAMRISGVAGQSLEFLRTLRHGSHALQIKRFKARIERIDRVSRIARLLFNEFLRNLHIAERVDEFQFLLMAFGKLQDSR